VGRGHIAGQVDLVAEVGREGAHREHRHLGLQPRPPTGAETLLKYRRQQNREAAIIWHRLRAFSQLPAPSSITVRPGPTRRAMSRRAGA
jgi:hypothetical protein